MPSFNPSSPEHATVTFAEGSNDEKGEVIIKLKSGWNDQSSLGTLVFGTPREGNYIVQTSDPKFVIAELAHNAEGFELGSETSGIAVTTYRVPYVVHELPTEN